MTLLQAPANNLSNLPEPELKMKDGAIILLFPGLR
jgi:hypothetical protein